MSIEADNQIECGSRKSLMLVMLGQTLGPINIIRIPRQAVMNGAIGHIMLYAAIYILIGIPLLYMEYVISQFTGRNCLEVWKARACLSHVAYVQIFWQIFNLVYCHLNNAFVLHYFLISFEKSIPYYICGSWSSIECNILHYNYTVHQECSNSNDRKAYCSQFHNTFPEYQYWRYYMLGLNKNIYTLAWRVSLASGLICIVLFLTNFRRAQSLKISLKFLIVFIISASVLLLIGSMLQKGIVIKFNDAVDANFYQFSKNAMFSNSVAQVLFSLQVGSGISFIIASKSSFRSPCYSNTVIIVIISGATTIINICSGALMLCPYSSKYNVHPLEILQYPIFFTYEMIPRMLYVYELKLFWLILSYSFIAISILCANIVIISGLVELISKRYPTIAKYPGIITLITVMGLYIVTIPLLGNKSIIFIIEVQREINILTIFAAILECFVFLLCYGLERFSEDIHFMLGVRPNAFIRISWIISFFVLIYVFCIELYTIFKYRNETWGTIVGWWLLIIIIVTTIFVTLLKISIAFYKSGLQRVICLNSSWVPKSEILQRSRTMFNTHAMTKEYIYRQYHLQAGILMRQRSCNIRN